MASDLFLPSSGIHLIVEERAGEYTDWMRRVSIGTDLATMRAHEYRGVKATVRTLSLVILVPGDIAIMRVQGVDWDELEHRLRTKARGRGLEHFVDAFVYQTQAVA